jgi:Na+-transporting NADH:ubiquinone oxidoreductase subunit NqrB
MPAAAFMETPGQRRRIRRSAWLWALIAAGFYFGFIIMMLVRASR